MERLEDTVVGDRPAEAGPGPMRTPVAAAVGLAAAIAAFVASVGLGASLAVAGLVAAATLGLIGWTIHRSSLAILDGSAASRGVKVVSGLATVAALVQLARLAVFMVDPSQAGYSVRPTSQWELRHSCFSAYFVAGNAAARVPDLYDDSLYSLPNADPTARRKPRSIGPFDIDVYEYPPTFLLLPRALARLAPDLLRMRALWFGLNVAVVLAATLLIARALGPSAGTRALLLAPLVWAAPPTINTLQKGNVQLMVIALSMLAMALFARRRPRLGGLLLAFATLSKIYPGMLLVYLLARRQWRALFWTGAFAAVLVVASLLDTGWAPFAAFSQHLPLILGGEAFPALRNPAAVAINYSVPGLVLKLKLFGVAGTSLATAKLVGWLYTLFVVWAAIGLGRRSERAGERPAAWLTVLFLATLRSPFLPQTYAVFPSLWLLTLLAAAAPGRRALALTLLGWMALCVSLPVDAGFDPRLMAIVILALEMVTIALAMLAVRRSDESLAPAWQPALDPSLPPAQTAFLGRL